MEQQIKTLLLITTFNYLLGIIYNKINILKWRHYYSPLVVAIPFVLTNNIPSYLLILSLGYLSYYLIKYNAHAYWMPYLVYMLCAAGMALGCWSDFVVKLGLVHVTKKIVGFCWNVYESAEPVYHLEIKDLSESHELVETKPKPRNVNEKEVIYDIPRCREYLGYLFFFPSFYFGPSLTFNQYRKSIEKKSVSFVIPIIETFFTTLAACLFLIKFGKGSLGYVLVGGLVVRIGMFVFYKASEGVMILCGVESDEPVDRIGFLTNTYLYGPLFSSSLALVNEIKMQNRILNYVIRELYLNYCFYSVVYPGFDGYSGVYFVGHLMVFGLLLWRLVNHGEKSASTGIEWVCKKLISL